MKIRIECTLNVDPKVIKKLMQQRLLADSDETVRDFVRSHVISGGVGIISDALYDAHLPDAVDVIKTNL